MAIFRRLKRVWHVAVLLFISMPLATHACHPQNIKLTQAVELTESEKQFIHSLSSLRVAAIYAPPLAQYNSDSNAFEGIAADVFCFIAEQIGLKYHFLTEKQSLASYLQSIRNGSIDVFMPLSQTAEREQWGLFSSSYYSSHYAVIADQRRHIAINNLEDLANYKIGIVKGAILESVLKARLPQASFILLEEEKDSRILYDALQNKKIDVLVHNKKFFKKIVISLKLLTWFQFIPCANTLEPMHFIFLEALNTSV